MIKTYEITPEVFALYKATTFYSICFTLYSNAGVGAGLGAAIPGLGPGGGAGAGAGIGSAIGIIVGACIVPQMACVKRDNVSEDSVVKVEEEERGQWY